MAATHHRICDYRDTDYAAFWADGSRDYEDAVERMALRRLMGSLSGRCLEVGAGYGRLVNTYAEQFDSVLLTDYADNLLAQARERVTALGLSQVRCECWDLYELSTLERRFDAVLCVRVLHHVEDVPAFFEQVARVLRDGGTFVLEFPNKRNLLEIARLLAGRPNIGPFDRRPTARKGDLYYNYHPAYVEGALREAGFAVEETLSVSLFRSEVLKRLVGARRLAAMERPLQAIVPRLSPSVFVRARRLP